MTSNVFHDALAWGMRTPYAQNGGLVPDMSNEEFNQYPFMAEGFPLIMTGDLDPWITERFCWNGETLPTLGQYPEKWDAAHMESGRKGQENSDPASCADAHTDSVHSRQQWFSSEKQHHISQLATERALFMTPSAYPQPFPTFPASPISDLCSTPDMSHAASSLWEADQERDLRSSLSSNREMYMQALSPNSGTASYFSGEDDNDYPTTLEMPDGSTRRTSNWLPVDPQAGFTIGSHSRKRDSHTSYMHLEGMEDIQEAFISPNTAGWKYDG